MFWTSPSNFPRYRFRAVGNRRSDVPLVTAARMGIVLETRQWFPSDRIQPLHRRNGPHGCGPNHAASANGLGQVLAASTVSARRMAASCATSSEWVSGVR